MPGLCEGLEPRLFLSLAPTSVAADTFVLYKTAGTGNSGPPGANRDVIAQSGNTFTNTDLIGTKDFTGTYTYAATGDSTATIVFSDSGKSNTINLTFSTSQNGTYNASNASGTDSGIFSLFIPPVPSRSPSSIISDTLQLSITAGGGIFASSGSYNVITSGNGSNFTLQTVSGSTTNSVGTYSYSKTANAGGDISYNDTTDNTTGVLHLAFLTSNSGLYYNVGPNTQADFQAGTFVLQTATATVLTPDVNPAIVNSTVTLTAIVTPPSANGNTATGNVTFMDGSTSLGTVAIGDTGHATLATASLAFGPHTITAVYSGDANFIGSTSASFTEHIVLTHANNITLVNSLYEQLLNRPAENTASGLQYWVGRLDNGDPLSDVADGIATSTEFYTDEVTSIYETYLHRGPDQTGLTAWVGKLQAGTINFETIRGYILGSEEFYNNMINQYGNYLTGLYQTLLGRNPDSTGIAAWTPAGGAGAWAPPATDDIRDIAAIGISNSFEQIEDFVAAKFHQFLNRNPSAPTAASQPSSSLVTSTNPNGIPTPADPVSQGEQGYWADSLSHGLTDDEFIADLLSSNEYIQDQGL